VEPIIQASGPAAQIIVDYGADGPSSATATQQYYYVHLGGLSLTNGAQMEIESAGSVRTTQSYYVVVLGTLGGTTQPLNIDPSSTLDLTDNDLIDFDSSSDAFATVQSYIEAAADGGAWDQPGLTSSVAADNANLCGLGYSAASTLGLSTFDDVDVAPSSGTANQAVVVKYTLLGDTQLRGTVGIGDYHAVLNNYGSGTDWTHGDFNYAGVTGLGDYYDVLSNYGASVFATTDLPRGLLVTTASETGDPQTSVDLAWQEPNDPDDTGDTYGIQYWTAGNQSNAQMLPITPTVSGTTLTYTQTGLAPGTLYYFNVYVSSYMNGNGSYNFSSTRAMYTQPGEPTATISGAGTSITLSAAGTDPLGSSASTFTWSAPLIPYTATPTSPAPTFSANGTNAAQSTTATIDGAGDYLFELTIQDPDGAITTDNVEVTVDQIPATLAGITTTPSDTTTIASGSSLQFSAVGTDQFGAPLDSDDDQQITWTATDPGGALGGGTGDPGTIDNTGLYIPPTDNGGTMTITAAAPSGSPQTSTTISVPTNAPDTITATESTDSTSVEVDWANDNTINNAAGFDLFRETNGGTPAEIADNVAPATTSFTDSNVTVGSTYAYYLVPFEIVGGDRSYGTASPTATVTLVGAITATPSADPVLVDSSEEATTPVSISVPFTDTDPTATHTATIDWGDENGGPPDTSAGTVTESDGSTPGTAAFSNSGMAPGTYSATVTISNASNDGSTSSTPIEIEVGGIPDAPSSASASASSGNVTVTWTPDSNDTGEAGYEATGYNIYGSTDNGTTWMLLDSVDASSVSSGQGTDNISGLTPSTSGSTVSYIFKVTATNDFGESASAAETSSTSSPLAPDAPTGLTATLAGGNVILNWTSGDPTNPAIATSYNIYESTGGGSTYSFFDSVTSDNPGTDAPPTTYTATGLTAGTTPLFEVTAANAGGESADSTPAGVRIPTGVSSVTATASTDGSSATVSWTPDTTALGYVIFRTPDDGSTGPQLVKTITDGSTGTYTDDTVDDTESYTYEVDPYYTNPPPTTPDGDGSGSGASGDDYTGNISDFNATVSGTTVNFTWSYQGGAGFELEEEDQSDAGTNYSWIASPTGRSATVSNLNPGDNYSFRLRADRPDGTVSDYVEASANIAASPTTPPTSNPDLTIEQPTISNATQSGGTPTPGEWDGTIDITPYDNPEDPTGSDAWYDLYNVTARDGDQFNIENDGDITGGITSTALHGDDWLSFISVTGTTGATYSFEAAYWDFYTGQFSPRSSPLQVTLPGTLPPKLSLQSDPTDPSAVTWDMPDGVDSGTVTFYYTKQSSGKTVAVSAGSADLSDGTYTFSGLPGGTQNVFAIYGGEGEDGQIDGTSPYSNDVQVSSDAAPAAPQSVSGTYVPGTGGAPGYVELHWTNSSNNETKFEVQRSSNGSAGPWTSVSLPGGADTTKLDDKSLSDLGPWTYEVRAVNSAGNSAWTLTTNPISPIGGPNVTVHLLAIAKDFKSYFAGLRAPSAWAAQFITTVNGAIDAANAGNTTLLVNNISNWDIVKLKNNTVTTASNNGMLPGGQRTVTVAGSVYLQDTVNYWLYGVMASVMGWPLDSLLQFVGWSKVQRGLGGNPSNEKQYAWIIAGYNDDTGLPSALLIEGGLPLPAANVQGVGGAPLTDDPGPLEYKVGTPPNQHDAFK
jgi:hypothetical protein